MTAGVDRPPADLAAGVHEQTEGNPFFIGEVVRLLASEGRLGEDQARQRGGDPAGRARGRRQAPRPALRRRQPGRSRLAAVGGRDFDRRGRADRRPGPPTRSRRRSTRRWTRSSCSSRRRRRGGSASPTRWCARRSTPRSRRRAAPTCTGGSPRRSRHALRRIAVERELAELAHHFLEAAPAGEAERGGRLRARAAAPGGAEPRLRGGRRPLRAGARGARARAAAAARRAPRAAARRSARPQTQGGRLVDARAAIWSAPRSSRATLGRGGATSAARRSASACVGEVGVVDERLIALLEEALEATGPDDSTLRVAAALRPRAGALLGRPGGRRTSSAPRRWRWRGGSATRRRSPWR